MFTFSVFHSLSLSKLFFLFCRHLTEGGPAYSFRCCSPPQNLSSPRVGVGSEASPGIKQFNLSTRSILKVSLHSFRADDQYTDLVINHPTCAIMSSTLSALVKDDFATGSSSVTWSLRQGLTIVFNTLLSKFTSCIQHSCSNYDLAFFCTSGFSVRQAVFLG